MTGDAGNIACHLKSAIHFLDKDIIAFSSEEHKENSYDKKEIFKNEIMIKMKYHLDKNQMSILETTLAEILYQVDIVDAVTLPATIDVSNEYILELYELKEVWYSGLKL